MHRQKEGLGIERSKHWDENNKIGVTGSSESMCHCKTLPRKQRKNDCRMIPWSKNCDDGNKDEEIGLNEKHWSTLRGSRLRNSNRNKAGDFSGQRAKHRLRNFDIKKDPAAETLGGEGQYNTFEKKIYMHHASTHNVQRSSFVKIWQSAKNMCVSVCVSKIHGR